MGPEGAPCGLKGQSVGRSTACPLTGKKWKSCCGKASGGRADAARRLGPSK